LVPVTPRSIAITPNAAGANVSTRSGQPSHSQLAASQGDSRTVPTTTASASIVPDARQSKNVQAIREAPPPSA
jgi:hypothetical protein